jgi:hypothetical protein
MLPLTTLEACEDACKLDNAIEIALVILLSPKIFSLRLLKQEACQFLFYFQN